MLRCEIVFSQPLPTTDDPDLTIGIPPDIRRPPPPIILRSATIEPNCSGRSWSQPMFKHILIATDGSEVATKAVNAGLKLAKKLAAQVVVMTASEPLRATVTAETIAANFPAAYEKATQEAAAKVLGEVRSEARTIGVECETLHVINSPAEAIIETAKDNACDLIVMGSHGRRGIARLLLGSQATKVVTLSSVPVLICR
jgi:nucleotide-binding universal stress UspA family protein